MNASVVLPPFSFLSLSVYFSFLCLLLLPSRLLFCFLCFPLSDCHRLTAASGPCAVQPCGPASLPSRVMYDWLALTSPRAQRHSNSVLPGLCFLVLSLGASPLFLLLLYPPLITSLFYRFLFLCAIYCFPPSPHQFLYLVHHFSLPLALIKTYSCLSSLSTLAPLEFFYSRLKLHPLLRFSIYSARRHTNIPRHDMFEVGRQAASQPSSHVKCRLIPIQLHLSRSTLFLDNRVS